MTDQSIFTVSTDQTDYAPGTTATITVDGLAAGTPVQFTVEVMNAGSDGIYGTADDFVDAYQTSLLGESPWYATEDGEGDGAAEEGVLRSFWYVDPDALNQTLRLTARTAGADGIYGTADDGVATTSFADAAGSTNKVY